eukprot:11589447-Heterocapsa_arctica.AAC.1
MGLGGPGGGIEGMRKSLERVGGKVEELEKAVGKVEGVVSGVVKETVGEWKEEEERRTGKLQQ